MTKKEKKIVAAAIKALSPEEKAKYDALDDSGKAAFAENVIAEAAKAAAAEKIMKAMTEEQRTEFDAMTEADQEKFILGAIADAEAAEKKAAEERAAAETEVVEVLVLSKCHHGACGSVAKLTKAEVKAAKEAGLVDDTPAAVKAAKG